MKQGFYSLMTIWHERNRFIPGILGVTFSAVLIAIQCGLLLGMFSTVTIPIDRSSADVWVGFPGVESIDLALPIPAEWKARLDAQPEVERSEIYLRGFILWPKPQGGAEMCAVIGSRLDDDALGAVQDLTPAMRRRLSEPGAVIIDESERERLGISGVGHVAEVAGCRLRVIDFVRGLKGLAGVYVFCSLETARRLLASSGLQPDQVTYLLGRCRNADAAAAVARRLRQYSNMSAFTQEELSLRSRLHWLIKTRAGLALSCAALLGLIVGAAVTSQTLYAATAASAREYAVLEALGIPTRHLVAMVLTQAFWVGLLGILLALPAIVALDRVFESLGSRVLLPNWLLGLTVAVTLVMALVSGLLALRSLQLAEPANLLR